MTTQELSFRFVPLSPTKTAWDSRPFRQFSSAEDLFDALKTREKKLGTFKYFDGFIYFKEGFYSTYKDGTEPTPYRNPKWWRTGNQTCWRKCCSTKPDEEEYSNTEPAIIMPKPSEKQYQEFKRIRGCGGAEEQYNDIQDKTRISKIWLNNVGWFFVEPR